MARLKALGFGLVCVVFLCLFDEEIIVAPSERLYFM